MPSRSEYPPYGRSRCGARLQAPATRRAKGDSSEIEQHSIQDQIAADRYLASKDATQRKGLPFRTTKLVPPGTA